MPHLEAEPVEQHQHTGPGPNLPGSLSLPVCGGLCLGPATNAGPYRPPSSAHLLKRSLIPQITCGGQGPIQSCSATSQELDSIFKVEKCRHCNVLSSPSVWPTLLYLLSPETLRASRALWP
ncbi:hypothetical protein EYF80_017107 [Liparis tanakae]|uniref:Uncharacterized protein n=1 Tax=Liparis tanakae TaxID=230148 RepID=A0A4Z2I3Y6_9TELE|nr:hypothetical protein EYF80_017107 [Liparis tanakae]